jgi:putative heme-binding domain-containing protein
MPAERRQRVLAEAKNAPNPMVRDLFERFLPQDERRKVLGTQFDAQTILSLKGNASHGRQTFFQEGAAQCYTCHRIAGEGREFGPDLAQTVRKYDRAQLLDQILHPSKIIDPQFAAVSVETAYDLYTGYIVRRTEKELVLRMAGGVDKLILTSEVKRTAPQQVSLMPEGLLQGLTAQEAADLLEFLRSL